MVYLVVTVIVQVSCRKDDVVPLGWAVGALHYVRGEHEVPVKVYAKPSLLQVPQATRDEL